MSQQLAQLIRKRRFEVGLFSQRDLARKACLSHSYVALLEKGEDPRTRGPLHPSLETLSRLAQALQLPIEDLLHAVGYPLPHLGGIPETARGRRKGAAYRSLEDRLAQEIAEAVARYRAGQEPVSGVPVRGFPGAENVASSPAIGVAPQIPETDFAVIATGRSLEKVGILEGDIVYLSTKKEPVQGDLVLAEAGGLVALRVLGPLKDNRRLLSQPGSNSFQAPERLAILGTVAALLRR